MGFSSGSFKSSLAIPDKFIVDAMLSQEIQDELSGVTPYKFDAIVPPTVDNDINDSVNASDGIGFRIGSVWIDTVGNNTYKCLDATDGAAVWITTTLDTSDLGDLAVLDTVSTTEIDDSSVTNAKMSDMVQDTIKGRAAASTGAPEDITASQVRSIINVEDGSTADQTGAEIKTAYEAEADTNAFTDAYQSKLDGIPVHPLQTNAIFVSKAGDDSNSGRREELPKLTIGAALTAAAALSPSSSNTIGVYIVDSGIYSENVTAIQWVDVIGLSATIIGALNLSAESSVLIKRVQRTGGNTVSFGAASGISHFRAEEVLSTGSATAVSNYGAASILYSKIDRISVETGVALSQSGASGALHIDVLDIEVAGNGGTAIKVTNGNVYGEVDYIAEDGTPTTTLGLDIDAGTASITVNSIIMDTVYDVESGAILCLLSGDITGTELNDGTVNLTKASHGNNDGSDHSFLDQAVTIAASPSHAGLRVTGLATGDNIITTDSDGDLQESGVSVESAPAGGSGIVVVIYPSAPSAPSTGFIWAEDIDANTKKIALYDGSNTFSVALYKE